METVSDCLSSMALAGFSPSPGLREIQNKYRRFERRQGPGLRGCPPGS